MPDPYIDPYIDPPDYHDDRVDYLDPRHDPTQRENPPEFWAGYGLYRQGTNYDKVPQTRHHLAGWFFGLREGREPPKPLWWSKHTVHGLATVGLAIFGYANWETVVEHPGVTLIVGTIMGTLEVLIRRVTRSAIR